MYDICSRLKNVTDRYAAIYGKKIKFHSKINFLTSTFLLHQIVNEPTHVMKTSSCNDLIFTSELNLVIESGVHSSYVKHHD